MRLYLPAPVATQAMFKVHAVSWRLVNIVLRYAFDFLGTV